MYLQFIYIVSLTKNIHTHVYMIYIYTIIKIVSINKRQGTVYRRYIMNNIDV